MNPPPAQRRIVTISFDFTGRAIHDRQLMENKVKRDPDMNDASVLVLTWSKRRETIEVSPQITVESFRAFADSIRPLYDLLFICVAPYILWRRRERPDAIVVQEFPLLWAAYVSHLIVGGEVVLRLTNLPTDLARTRGSLNRFYHRMNELFAKRLASRYVAINETTKAYLLRLGVPAHKISIAIPDTIMTDRQFITAARSGVVRGQYGIAKEMPVILSVGRFEKEKGFTELLELFAQAKMNMKLILVGDGVLRTALEEQAHALGISENVIFAGIQDRAHIWNYYADANAFVLVSKSEALGLVFWEAMYMRVPVIGRPVGGIRETIGDDGERGFLWDSADGPEAFKRNIEQAVARGPDVEAMVERARAYVIERTGAPAPLATGQA